METGGVWVKFDFEAQDKEQIEIQSKTSGKRRESVGKALGNKLGNKLGNTRTEIMSAMKNDPKVSGSQLAKIVGISTTAIEKNIKFLRENGFIERIGGTRGYWEVIDE